GDLQALGRQPLIEGRRGGRAGGLEGQGGEVGQAHGRASNGSGSRIGVSGGQRPSSPAWRTSGASTGRGLRVSTGTGAWSGSGKTVTPITGRSPPATAACSASRS